MSPWPLLPDHYSALALEVEETRVTGRALGLTDAEVEEVIGAFREYVVARPIPMPWPTVRTALIRRALGQDWTPGFAEREHLAVLWPVLSRDEAAARERRFGVLAEALHLPQVVDWIERQIERWPWLYRVLSR